jgi:TonB-linked SusC/RagA family outer membrane protein
LYHYLESNTQEIRIGSDYLKTNTFSYFGRINYKFNERYLLTASLRRDGSSVLAPGHKWATYPSIAAGWRINEESFMSNVANISNLKLRLSWGKSGNSAIDPYSTLGGLGSSQYSFNNKLALGYYPKLVSNPDLGWETTDVYDVGLDLGLYGNRIALTADVYKSFTSDLLLSRVLPMSSGYNSIMQNIGKTENIGLDVTLNTLNIRNQNFQWSTDINFSTSKEKITQLSSGVTEDVENKWFVGSPIKVFYDYKKIGIWQLDEAEEAAKYGSKPGEIKVEDVDKNGTIDVKDRVKFKQRPDFTIGMNNSFVIKNVDFSIFAYARVGQYINYTYNTSYKAQGLENGSNVNYWTPENPSNDFPRPDASVVQTSRLYFSTLGIVKGSFLKIKNINLGYTLPKDLIGKWHINNLRLYVTGQNLFTFSKLKDYDPERGGGESFPMTRQIVFGLNLDF